MWVLLKIVKLMSSQSTNATQFISLTSWNTRFQTCCGDKIMKTQPLATRGLKSSMYSKASI